MKKLVDSYIEDHETAWAPSTLKSECSRLRAVSEYLDGKPEDLYQYLVHMHQKPYTIKTTFIRVCAMEKWAKNGTKFQDFMSKHSNRFKHAYTKEEIDVTYAEALDRIRSLPEDVRSAAEGLLRTGLRTSEQSRVHDGIVTGKGGKTRRVYGKIGATVPRSTLWKHLRSVGLKPHTLRKLCATRLAEMGATPADLCKIFGWSSIGTAYQYLQAKEDERLESLMEESQKGS